MVVAGHGPRAPTAENPKGLTHRRMDVLVLPEEGPPKSRIDAWLFAPVDAGDMGLVLCQTAGGA